MDINGMNMHLITHINADFTRQICTQKCLESKYGISPTANEQPSVTTVSTSAPVLAIGPPRQDETLPAFFRYSPSIAGFGAAHLVLLPDAELDPEDEGS